MARGPRIPRDMNEAVEEAKKLPTYGRLVWALARDPRVPARQKLVLAGIAAYLMLPIDVIPDFVPLIGQLDDLAILVFGLDWFIKNAPQEVVDDHLARIARHDDVLGEDLGKAEGLLADRVSELRGTLERIRSRSREGGDA
jgi:uncharacterized membrane protein YkvA (DUF1232 family)